MKGTMKRCWSIRSCWGKLRQSRLQSALLLRRIQHPWRRHLMFRQDHRRLALLLCQHPELLTPGRSKEEALLGMVVMEEMLLLVRGEERERPKWALRVKGSEQMERGERLMWALRVKVSEQMERGARLIWALRVKVSEQMGRGARQRVAAQKEKGRALVVIPVVVIPRERLSLRDRILLR